MTERLLACLQRRANSRGLVLTNEEQLLRELATSREMIAAELDKLERSGLIEVHAPLPFLVLKLRSWSGKAKNVGTSQPSAYSYSKLSSNRLNESYRPSDDDALLREILDTLGETDPTSFEGAIKNFPPDVIRKALDRVRRTRSLRKNPTALFRYLLTKLS
jgi:hypothetical protein